jgi:DNA-directed RNA polymerase subunit K/omega
MIDIDKIHSQLSDGDGRYMVVNIVARRARDLNKRKVSNLFEDTMPDPTDTALTEFQNGLLRWEFRHHLVGTGGDYRGDDYRRD